MRAANIDMSAVDLNFKNNCSTTFSNTILGTGSTGSTLFPMAENGNVSQGNTLVSKGQLVGDNNNSGDNSKISVNIKKSETKTMESLRNEGLGYAWKEWSAEQWNEWNNDWKDKQQKQKAAEANQPIVPANSTMRPAYDPPATGGAASSSTGGGIAKTGFSTFPKINNQSNAGSNLQSQQSSLFSLSASVQKGGHPINQSLAKGDGKYPTLLTCNNINTTGSSKQPLGQMGKGVVNNDNQQSAELRKRDRSEDAKAADAEAKRAREKAKKAKVLQLLRKALEEEKDN